MNGRVQFGMSNEPVQRTGASRLAPRQIEHQGRLAPVADLVRPKTPNNCPHFFCITLMNQLLRFSGSVKRDPAIETWMKAHTGELGVIARYWFEVMRKCGDDVRELLHDGHPTACIADAAFGYVNAFKAHVNVGFFRGAEIADPEGLLEGTGKFMRHVKLRPDRDLNATALTKLIATAYTDMKERVRAIQTS